MPERFPCPGCQGSLAWSAAIPGRSVRCHLCGHAFTLTTPPNGVPLREPALATTASATIEPPPLPRTRTPPPLPSRNGVGRPARAAALDEVDEPAPLRQTHRRPAAARRSSGIAALIGLIAVFFCAFVVIAGGIGYLVWPKSSASTAPASQSAAPPIERPTDYERPKDLNELLGNGGNIGEPKSSRTPPAWTPPRR
jgi:hypothetical protein